MKKKYAPIAEERFEKVKESQKGNGANIGLESLDNIRRKPIQLRSQNRQISRRGGNKKSDEK